MDRENSVSDVQREDVTATERECPARDGGWRCGLRLGHRGEHKAVKRHSWSDAPTTVHLHRNGQGRYEAVLNDVHYDVVKVYDASVPSTYAWDLSVRGGESLGYEVTTADVRKRILRHALSAKEATDG